MKPLKDFVIIVNILINLLRPSIQFNIERIEANKYKKENVVEGEIKDITYDSVDLVMDMSTIVYEIENKIPYMQKISFLAKVLTLYQHCRVHTELMSLTLYQLSTTSL